MAYHSLFSKTLEVTARLAYDWYWYEGNYVYDYGPPLDIVVNNDLSDGEWLSAEVFATWDALENHRLVGGVELRNSTQQTQDIYDAYGSYLDSDTDMDNWGVFLQETYTPTEQISFNLGIRYDEYSDTGSSVNPRAAAIYAPFDSTSLKLLYGTAFRVPNAYELYYEDNGISQKTNDSLSPETITSYEFVVEHLLTSNIRTSASVYYNNLEDLIVLTQDPSDELLVFNNLGSAEARGVEIDLNGRWENGWNTSLSYTLQDAEDGNDNRLVNSPRHMAKLNLTAPILPDGLLSGGLEMQYTSERLTLGRKETGESFVTNLVLLSRNLFDFEGVTVSAAVYNLLDERYSYPVSDAHRQDSVEQEGRVYRLKIDYLW